MQNMLEKPARDDIARIVGERVVQLRTKKGITQKQLADEVGLRRLQIHNIEHGKNVPRSDVLFALADYFGVSLDVFRGRSVLPSAKK